MSEPTEPTEAKYFEYGEGKDWYNDIEKAWKEIFPSEIELDDINSNKVEQADSIAITLRDSTGMRILATDILLPWAEYLNKSIKYSNLKVLIFEELNNTVNIFKKIVDEKY